MKADSDPPATRQRLASDQIEFSPCFARTGGQARFTFTQIANKTQKLFPRFAQICVHTTGQPATRRPTDSPAPSLLSASAGFVGPWVAKLRQFWQDFKLLATQRFEPRISGLVAGEAGAAHSQQEATAWRPQGSVADTKKQRPQLTRQSDINSGSGRESGSRKARLQVRVLPRLVEQFMDSLRLP